MTPRTYATLKDAAGVLGVKRSNAAKTLQRGGVPGPGRQMDQSQRDPLHGKGEGSVRQKPEPPLGTG